jgi:hypothetical protein
MSAMLRYLLVANMIDPCSLQPLDDHALAIKTQRKTPSSRMAEPWVDLRNSKASIDLDKGKSDRHRSRNGLCLPSINFLSP